MSTLQNKVNFICFLLKITRPWRTFLKIAISISRNIRIDLVWFYCIMFCLWTFLLHKSLNKINLIEIDSQTKLSKLGGIDFVGDRTQKNLKTVFNFLFFFSVKSFAQLPHTYHRMLLQKLFSFTPEMTEKTCKNWKHIRSIIKTEVDVIWTITDQR